MATAQVVTIQEFKSHPFIKKIVWDWACTDLGAVSSQTTGYYTGELIRLITIPDGGGDAPTNLYDVTILDSDSVDVLIGAGMNRAAASTEQAIASALGAVYNSRLTLTIAAAGDAKKGLVLLYIKTYRL